MSYVLLALQEIDVAKVRNLYLHPGTPGEKAAAFAALKRMGHDPSAADSTRGQIHKVLNSKGFSHDLMSGFKSPVTGKSMGPSSQYTKGDHLYNVEHDSSKAGKAGSYFSPQGDVTVFKTHDDLFNHAKSLNTSDE